MTNRSVEAEKQDQESRYDERLMPMTMGAPQRTPYYSYGNWGLIYKGEEQIDAAYEEEWGAGNAGQLALVSEAMIRAGYGDFPNLLRSETAMTVSALLQNRTPDQPLTILDIGSGPGLSALETYNALPDRLKPLTTIILLDPSAQSLEGAAHLMEQNGIKFKTVNGTDSEEIEKMEENSVDVVIGVASIHHHAKIPFDAYARVLKNKGFAVFADWHHSLWEHPGGVLRLLQELDWPQKDAGIRNWVATYPKAVTIPSLPDNSLDKKAIEQIISFWKSYHNITQERNLGQNAIWPLEGHRPVEKYMDEMRDVGFAITGQRQILEDSSLLQVTVGQKTSSDVLGRYFRMLAHLDLQLRRDAGEQISPSHSETHLNSVAKGARSIGEAFGFSSREILLGTFAAQFHDIRRSAREDLGDEDETSSADEAVAVLLELNNKGRFESSEEEREAVAYAIIHHGKSPVFLQSRETRQNIPDSLSEKLHVMLYISDGLQKLGAPLIQRRSAFVGGERLKTGDLQDMRFQDTEIDAIQAVLLESAVRLGWKNTEDIYPNRVKQVIAPAFAVQRKWISGLLAATGLSMQDWSKLAFDARNNKGNNIFEHSGIQNPPSSVEDVRETLEKIGKIFDEDILSASEDIDLQQASVKAVEYFSSNYSKDSSLTVRNWQPKSKLARQWKEEM